MWRGPSAADENGYNHRPRRSCRGAAAMLFAAAAIWFTAATVSAQPSVPQVPGFWQVDPDRRVPDPGDREWLHFLTEDAYPPFSYTNSENQLTGFNVEIARAICDVLKVGCRISIVSWDQLIPALEKSEADAVIASLAISKDNLSRVDFTAPYYRTPARFVVGIQSRVDEARPQTMVEKRVGVVRGSAHEAYLRAFFQGSRIYPFASLSDALEAVRTGAIDAVFADGINLMYWLNGAASRGCCRFADGAYTESRYFGLGAGIAVRKGDAETLDLIGAALDRIKSSGVYDRIYLKYFPLALY